MYYGVMLGPSRRVSRRQREPRYALLFDGVDDYGDLGISRIHYEGGSVGLFAGPEEQWTVEFWVRPFSNSNGGIVGFSKAGGSGSANQIFSLPLNGGGARPTFWLRGSATSRPLQPLNVWTHYAISWDGEVASLVFNGALQDPLSVGNREGDHGILIGARGGAALSGFFHGLKRDLRIWNYARTYEEIVNNMHRTLTGTEPGLVGYWPLNEGIGAVAHDLTAQQNHMTIHGATWVEV